MDSLPCPSVAAQTWIEDTIEATTTKTTTTTTEYTITRYTEPSQNYSGHFCVLHFLLFPNPNNYVSYHCVLVKTSDLYSGVILLSILLD